MCNIRTLFSVSPCRLVRYTLKMWLYVRYKDTREQLSGRPLPSFSDFKSRQKGFSSVFLLHGVPVAPSGLIDSSYKQQGAPLKPYIFFCLCVTSTKWGPLLNFELWITEGMTPRYAGEDGCRHVGCSSSRRVILALHEGPSSGSGSSHAWMVLNIRYL